MSEMEKLTKVTEKQVSYQMQVNQMLLQQISQNKNLINGFRMLGSQIVKITRQLSFFASMIKTVATRMNTSIAKSLGFQTQSSTNKSPQLYDALTQAINATRKQAVDSSKEFKSYMGLDQSGPQMGGGSGISAASESVYNIFGGLTTQLQNSFQNIAGIFDGSFKERVGSLKEGLGGLLGAGKGLRGLATPKGGLRMLGGMGKAFSAMMPQMLAMMLIIKPVMALIQGLLEPFEPLIEVFGVLGEMLGLIFTPIIMEVTNALMSMIMAGAPLIEPLQEIALGLFNLISPMFAAINLMNETGASLGEAISIVMGDAFMSLLTGLGEFLPMLATLIMELLGEVINLIPSFISTTIDDVIPMLVDVGFATIAQVWEEMWGRFASSARDVGSDIKDWWTDLWD